MATAGRVLLLFKGEWIVGKTYVPMDTVLYSGASYVCKDTVSSATTPDMDSAHWQVLAKGFDVTAVAQELDNDPDKIPSNKAVSDALENIPTKAITVDLTGSGSAESPAIINADTLGHRITAETVDQKIKYTDALSLEAIEASSSLNNKVPTAQALKDAKNELNQHLVNKTTWKYFKGGATSEHQISLPTYNELLIRVIYGSQSVVKTLPSEVIATSTFTYVLGGAYHPTDQMDIKVTMNQTIIDQFFVSVDSTIVTAQYDIWYK